MAHLKKKQEVSKCKERLKPASPEMSEVDSGQALMYHSYVFSFVILNRANIVTNIYPSSSPSAVSSGSGSGAGSGSCCTSGSGAGFCLDTRNPILKLFKL